MALLSEYGKLFTNEVFDYSIHTKAIDTIIGVSSFPIIEDVVTDSSISIVGIEKSLWRKKQNGFVTIEYIEDLKADGSGFQYSNGEKLPEYAEILLGFEFHSIYNKYYNAEHIMTYNLGSPRKQILSYGILIHCLNMRYHAFTEEELKMLRIDVFGNGWKHFRTLSKSINDILIKLKLFDKYK